MVRKKRKAELVRANEILTRKLEEANKVVVFTIIYGIFATAIAVVFSLM